MIHHKIFEIQQFILDLFFHVSIEEAFSIPSHPFVELFEVNGEQDHVNCFSEISEGLEVISREVCFQASRGFDLLIHVLFASLSGAEQANVVDDWQVVG